MGWGVEKECLLICNVSLGTCSPCITQYLSLTPPTLSHYQSAAARFALAAAVRGYLFSIINRNILHRLRSRAFAAMISQPVAWFDSQDGAQLSTRLSADCAAVARLVATSANIALRNGLQCVGAAAYLFFLHRGMATAAGGVAAVLAGTAAAYGAFSRATQRQYQDALALAAGRAEESFRSVRTVRTFAAEPAAAARYGEALGELAQVSSRQAVAYGGFVAVNHWCYHAMRAAALAVGGLAALRGAIDTKQLTTFMLYAELFASSMLYATEQYGPIMESLGASERILAYLQRRPAPQLAGGAVPADEEVRGEIEFRNVSFTYPTRPKAPALVCEGGRGGD